MKQVQKYQGSPKDNRVVNFEEKSRWRNFVSWLLPEFSKRKKQAERVLDSKVSVEESNALQKRAEAELAIIEVEKKRLELEKMKREFEQSTQEVDAEAVVISKVNEKEAEKLKQFKEGKVTKEEIRERINQQLDIAEKNGMIISSDDFSKLKNQKHS